jgi:hypothetical protein
MGTGSEYTGTHQVILPSGYLDTIDAAIDLYEDEIMAVAANLKVEGLELSIFQRLVRSMLSGLAIWLAPAGWMICI